jgi:hypothetical protein
MPLPLMSRRHDPLQSACSRGAGWAEIMAAKSTSEAERIARMEAMFEQLLAAQAVTTENLKEFSAELAAIRKTIAQNKDATDKAQAADVAELERLKNRGWGILTTLSLAAGVAGVAFAAKIKAMLGIF